MGAIGSADIHLLRDQITKEREEERERGEAMLKISAKLEGLEEAKKMFSRDLIRKATRSAIDRSGTFGKNYIAGSITSNYNVQPKDAKAAIKVQRTTQASNEMLIIIKGKALALLDYFHAIQDRAGIYVNVSKTNTMRIPHAFINVARNSGKRVIMMRKGASRYPTTGKPGRGPSIPRLAGSPKIWESVKEKIMSFLNQEFKDQLEKRLRIKGK
jgi:hypothetical protein